MARILSLNLGKKRTYNGFESAMAKFSADGYIYCDENGFVGDCVSDTKNHGGIYKAVFANSVQNFAFFSYILGRELKCGELGENLSIDGLDESNVCVGDIHKIGELELLVTQPRKPCAKISRVLNHKDLTKIVHQTGFSGWYYKVLKPGFVTKGDEICVQKRGEISILQINQAFHNPKNHLSLIEKIVKLKDLAPKWDIDFERKIAKKYDDSYMYEI